MARAGRVVTERDWLLGRAGKTLFLLPRGRPRFLGVVKMAEGLPRRRSLLSARHSRLAITASICVRSWRSAASILFTSISPPVYKIAWANFYLYTGVVRSQSII